MINVTLQDAFRYILIGFAILGYQYSWDSECTEAIVEKLSIFGTTVVCMTVGAFVYIIYRILFYNTIIVWLQDHLRRTKCGSYNYRTYLKTKFKLDGDKPRQLYVFIRLKYLSNKIESYQSYFSGIHYVYMIGLVGIAYGIASRFMKAELFCPYIIVACVALLCGFFADRRAETDEYLLLKSLGNSKIDDAKKELFDE